MILVLEVAPVAPPHHLRAQVVFPSTTMPTLMILTGGLVIANTG